jgi:Cu(I)/Ag(I) efflux system membrane protein CusA/SilA
MKRIAAPMVGGMVSSTVLTLIVIPAIYSLWQESKLARAQRASQRARQLSHGAIAPDALIG